MAINYTVPNTFAALTVAESAKVNANETYTKSVFDGLEAGTKTMTQMSVDSVPTTSTQVATKAYVDYFNGYRRPVLQWSSTTTVAVESGMDGTSGNIPLLFPDGSFRTETSTTRTTFNITRNAVLTTSGAQSGLTGSTSEASNTWYALYGCKVTDSTTQWVTVGSTVLPLQANYATLNTAYGTNGWVYLGLIRNGDNSGATGDILDFRMVGNKTYFYNTCTGNAENTAGLRLATSAGASSLTYTFSSGTGTTDIPGNIGFCDYLASCEMDGTSRVVTVTLGTITYRKEQVVLSTDKMFQLSGPAGGVVLSAAAGTFTIDIMLQGFTDKVLSGPYARL